MKLLPTPTTRDFQDGQAAHRRDGIIQIDTLARTILNGAERERELMPTPKALDGVKGNLKTSQDRIDAGFFVDLPNIANDLAQHLPTPTASDWKGANHSGSGSASSRGIATVVEQTNWGKFEPAIRRWESTIGRKAPSPTKADGKDGAHRLSSKFTEWMMGLPDGWITGHGLSRNDELKMAGNGVVPQQAELALRILLEGIDIPAGGGQVNLPTPTVSDTFTSNLKSSQQKEGSMHSVTLPQAVERLVLHTPDRIKRG
jgi:site-specific DNA-cytosine methylase